MNIAIFEAKPSEIEYFKKSVRGHKLTFFTEPLNQKNVIKIKNAEAIVIFIYSSAQKEILNKLPKLKFITTKSTGFDHINIAVCKKRKIVVSNVPFYGENTVAEHTFALILSLSRNIHKSYVRTLRNDFSTEGLEGFDLKGKTLGVVGTGHIGLRVIKIAKGFGMDVLAYDVSHNTFLEEVLGFKYVALEKLLSSSDIITLHVPYNEHTHHLLNKNTMKHIKRGAILINTSRGGIIETDSLIRLLDKKILSGAGLDVLEGEELIREEKELLHDKTKTEKLAELVRDHIVITYENVVYTPHIAFYSKEALERILYTTVKNIISFDEKKPINIIK